MTVSGVSEMEEGARGTFKAWRRKLTQSCSARRCRLKSSGFEALRREEVGYVFLLSRRMTAVSKVSTGAGVAH